MADKYKTRQAGKDKLIEATTVSTGVAEAGDIVALDSTGKIDVTLLPTGAGPDTKILTATENLGAGKYVNIHSGGVRLADNSNGRDAHGFVLSAVTSGNPATVYFEGTNPGVTGRTIGARQYLGTAGDAVEVPLDETLPANAGFLSQFLGIAISATEINTDIDDCLLL